MPDVTARRIAVFAVIALLCVGTATVYVLDARRRSTAADGLVSAGIRVVEDPADLSRIAAAPHVAFRNTASGRGYGLTVLAGLDDPDGPRWLTGLACDRVDFAGGFGSCLASDGRVYAKYVARIFDASFNVLHTVALNGVPSRTRVAPNGRLAAATVFVTGHSYAAGAFSTQTTLMDTGSGTVLADLEQFTVIRDGAPFRAADFNFWGVTFAPDSNRFYATLATGGQLLLVEGDARARAARVLRPDVECPSLSPDGSRLGFKKRTLEGGALRWRLAVLDLASMTERVLTEPRSIDDQVEWLDDRRLVYAAPDDQEGRGGTSVWALDVDAAKPPVLWLRGAYSPSVVPQ